MKIKIGIFGYGNLGKAVEVAVRNTKDMTLVKVFSRRSGLKTVFGQEIENISNVDKYINDIDVMILCGGSKSDLPVQTIDMAKQFNIVDSFDTHANIPEHFANLDKVAKENKTLGCISTGWDPGLFSIARVIFDSILPDGDTYTFWGKGVSQGHSDAIRRVKGVKKGIQYTIPIQKALDDVRAMKHPNLTAREKHLRECFVVVEDGADKDRIRDEIVNMPNYFKDYDTVVNFISEEEFDKNHTEMNHGGFVMRTGNTHDNKYNYLLELMIKLDNNPGFTGSILTAYARAVYKMSKEGKTGAITVYDVPLALLSSKDPAELRSTLL